MQFYVGRYRLLLFQLLLVCGAVHAEPPQVSYQEYLYSEKIGQRLDAFDISNRVVYFDDIDYLKHQGRKHQTDFSGKVVLCTNAEYFCIRGGIYVAVPRKMVGQTNWEYEGLKCNSTAELNAQVDSSITCLFKETETTFTFDVSKGILSYSVRAERDHAEFVLASQCGLFGIDCFREAKQSR